MPPCRRAAPVPTAVPTTAANSAAAADPLPFRFMDTCTRLAILARLVALSATLPPARLLRQARRQSSHQLILIVQQSLRLRA